ncbi:MAG: hypothetical protein NTW67_00335 [Candidatus Woesearchaeota archaeon]|nr:hypothetical protein [Candidatus Woesearchaeota archaeon]
MGLGKWLEFIMKHMNQTATLAGLATFPYTFYELHKYVTRNPDNTFLGQLKYMAIPVAASLLTKWGLLTLYCYTREDTNRRTRIGDRKKIKKLWKELESKEHPKITFGPEQRINYSIVDVLRYHSSDFQELTQRARETENPFIALDASIRNFSLKAGHPDEGYTLFRDALDWMRKRKPKLRWKTKAYFLNTKLALYLSKFLEPRAIENYILGAIYESIINPEQAGQWTELGKLVADKFGSPQKPEMYVFHALLATAQKRSDEKEAWRTAFELIQQTLKPKRLGESRNPVWAVEGQEESKKFFSGTFAFKGNTERYELENEEKSAHKLEEILDKDAIAPEPIYITEEPYNELYVYIMRYLPGELLSNQFLKGDKRGLEKVIPVLARIHARYPTEGLTRLNLEEKTAKKLQSLGMQSALKYFRPVTADLQAHPIWAVNKDAHPEQWQMLNNPHTEAKVGVLDTEIKEVQPIVLDIANLLYYVGQFTREEREKYVGGHVSNLRKEGAKIHDQTFAQAYDGANGPLLRAVDNAAIFRMLCLIEAWSDPDRPNMRTQRERLVKTALQTIDDLKEHDTKYYSENETEYKALKERFPEFLKAT